MTTPASSNGDLAGSAGLPPVAPPSGRFIAQLFLVPGLIVTAAILLLLLFRAIVGGGYTAEQFLRQLDHANQDIRWRGASDLAQVLEKPENLSLRCDSAFALELTERLRAAWEELVEEEKELAKRLENVSAEEQPLRWRQLTPRRDFVRFLIAAVARSNAPVAIPVLADIAGKDDGPDKKSAALIRRQALWAFGILGQNIKDFAALPADHQRQILADLNEEIAQKHPRRSVWARNALKHLQPGQGGFDGLIQVDQVLARCAKADDPYLREQVALALLFWDGPLVEPTLHQLARDDGHGHLIRITEAD